jgi:hypothetical protein
VEYAGTADDPQLVVTYIPGYPETATFLATPPPASNTVYANGGVLTNAQDGVTGRTLYGALSVGQLQFVLNFYVYEAFISFDTSSIPDGATITAATLYLWGSDDQSAVDFTIEARAFDYGATIETGDFRTRAELTALTLAASRSTVGWSLGGYNTFTSDAALLSVINKSGATRFVLNSSLHRTGATPAAYEYIVFHAGDITGQEPKLVVTYTVP